MHQTIVSSILSKNEQKITILSIGEDAQDIDFGVHCLEELRKKSIAFEIF